MASRVLGIYIDCAGVESLADVRVCLVERTRGGKVVVRSAEEDSAMSAVMHTLSLEQLTSLMDMLHTPRKEAAS